MIFIMIKKIFMKLFIILVLSITKLINFIIFLLIREYFF